MLMKKQAFLKIVPGLYIQPNQRKQAQKFVLKTVPMLPHG